MKAGNREPAGAVDAHPKERMSRRTSRLRRTAVAIALAAMAPTAAHAATPIVFQATGPTAQSIQSAVEAFRAALGATNNGNLAGPITGGHREINWDGGGANTTTPPLTPFNNFLDSRGAQFTTRGAGLTQAPPSGPDGGLAGLFNNPTYETIFKAFSPLRLFGPVG